MLLQDVDLKHYLRNHSMRGTVQHGTRVLFFFSCDITVILIPARLKRKQIRGAAEAESQCEMIHSTPED